MLKEAENRLDIHLEMKPDEADENKIASDSKSEDGFEQNLANLVVAYVADMLPTCRRMSCVLPNSGKTLDFRRQIRNVAADHVLSPVRDPNP